MRYDGYACVISPAYVRRGMAWPPQLRAPTASSSPRRPVVVRTRHSRHHHVLPVAVADNGVCVLRRVAMFAISVNLELYKRESLACLPSWPTIHAWKDPSSSPTMPPTDLVKRPLRRGKKLNHVNWHWRNYDHYFLDTGYNINVQHTHCTVTCTDAYIYSLYSYPALFVWLKSNIVKFDKMCR
jgi:uncharacterized protein YmfQ (DUF2313 family)